MGRQRIRLRLGELWVEKSWGTGLSLEVRGTDSRTGNGFLHLWNFPGKSTGVGAIAFSGEWARPPQILPALLDSHALVGPSGCLLNGLGAQLTVHMLNWVKAGSAQTENSPRLSS